MELIDTHCHLDFAAFDIDREQVMNDMTKAGVVEVVVPGVTAAGWPALIEFARQRANVHMALGLHPCFLPEHNVQDLQQLADLLQHNQPVAVGEIGLDFAIAELDRQQQLSLFEQQLSMAEDHKLPVLVHARKSVEQVIQSVRHTGFSQGGIMHAFNGSLQQAEQLMQLGFKFGFGGMLTFARSNRLRKLAANLPEAAIVLETDAPDMTVASHRGERNSPVYLPEVLSALAEVRQQPEQLVAAYTTANARKLLKLSD